MGAMDKDSDPATINQGDYIDALNIIDSKVLNGNAIENVLSTRQVASALGSGDNFTICAVEDRINNSVVEFVYNDAGNHKIIRHWPTEERSVDLCFGPWLNFNKHWRPQAVVIDGRYLYWTDARSVGTTISGNELRKIDMDRAYIAGKFLSHEIYAGLPGQGQFANGNTYTVRVKNIANGANIASQTYVSNGAHLNDPAAGLDWLMSQMAGLATHFSINYCDCKLTVEMSTAGRYLEVVSSDGDVVMAPINYYAAPLTSMQPYMAAWAKEPPTCAPRAEYISDPTISTNNVSDGYFQFRYRFVYDTGEESAWSEISPVAMNCNNIGTGNDNLNAIKVDISDTRLSTPGWLGMIRFVDIAFRDGNTGIFKLIRRVESCKLGTSGSQYIVFSNAELYSAVPSDDTSLGNPDTQVLSLYHSVPRLAGTIAAIGDQDGDTRMIAGGTLEGFDLPDCADTSTTIIEAEEDCLITIKGTVSILNSPSDPLADPRFANYKLNGFVVYLAGTNFYAISNNPADGSGDGSFEIKGVPRGAYSLRVASYMCRFDNELGPRYNMLSGLDWQRSSSPVIDVAGSFAASSIRTERFIDLRAFTGAEFDLDTEAGYGDIKIQNAHARLTTSTMMCLAEVYVCDADGDFSTQELRKGADAVSTISEVQFWHGYISTGLDPAPAKTMQADHNGYAWHIHQRDFVNTGECFRVVVTPFGDSESNATPSNHLWMAPNSNPGNGWAAIWDNTAIDQGLAAIPNALLVDSTLIGKVFSGFMFNGDPNWTAANKTTYSGRVTGPGGSGIGDVLVWMALSSDYQYTNINGEYTLSFYAYAGSPFKVAAQSVYPVMLSDTCSAGSFTPEVLMTVRLFDVDSDGIAEPFLAQNFVSSVAAVVCGDRYLKSGGRYKWGIVYRDEYNRTPGVLHCGIVDIPFHTSTGQYTRRSFDWAISHVPPLWAKKYQVVRTMDSRYLTWQHIAAKDVKYANIPAGKRTATVVQFGSSSVTHILIQIPTFVEDTGADPILTLFSDTVISGYKAKYGDICRYVLDESGSVFKSGVVIEAPIIGEYIDGEDYYIVIPYQEVFKEIHPGAIFEMYTPKTSEDDVYYGTGVCCPIIDPGTPSRRHGGLYTDQTYSPDQPATGNILSGDVYWNDSTQWVGDSAFKKIVESPFKYGVSDRAEDIGCAYVVDPYGNEAFFYNQIRISGLFKPGSGVNRLSNFGTIDYIRIDRSFGPIKVAATVADVLLVVCQNKVQPVYVGKDRMIDLTGSNYVGRSATLLNIAAETRADAGTINPETLVVQDGRAFWWDQERSKVWQYSSAGVDDISSGMNTYFREISDERKYLIPERNYMSAGFDRRNGMYLLSFISEIYNYLDEDGRPTKEDTIGYSVYSQRPGWKSRYSFVPDAYVSIGDRLITYWNGFRHYMNQVLTVKPRCRIYNIDRFAEITFCANDNPATIKEFFVLRVQADAKVYSPLVYIDKTVDASAQSSRILAPHWLSASAQSWAEFKRDGNDPAFATIDDPDERYRTGVINGRRLIGHYAKISLSATFPQEKIIIFATDAEYGVHRQ